MMHLKMGNFLDEIHQSSPTVTLPDLLEVISVLEVLNMLNVLNVLNIPKDASLACWALFLESSSPNMFDIKTNFLSFVDAKLWSVIQIILIAIIALNLTRINS